MTKPDYWCCEADFGKHKFPCKNFLRTGMERAFWAANTSHDPDTQTGVAFFDKNGRYITSASNRIPFLITVTEERTNRPAKYNWIEHSERNAIYNHNRIDDFRGSTVFLNWFPCADCARALVSVEVKRLVYKIKAERMSDPRYGFQDSTEIMLAGGVELIDYDKVVPE